MTGNEKHNSLFHNKQEVPTKYLLFNSPSRQPCHPEPSVVPNGIELFIVITVRYQNYSIEYHHIPFTIHSDFFCLFKQKHSSHLHISFKLINSQHVFRFVCDTYMSVYLHGTLVWLPQTLTWSSLVHSLTSRLLRPTHRPIIPLNHHQSSSTHPHQALYLHLTPLHSPPESHMSYQLKNILYKCCFMRYLLCCSVVLFCFIEKILFVFHFYSV